MTFRVNFFAEQAYLSFVKESLANPIADHEKAVERGAVCIVALACAFESIINLLLKEYSDLRHYGDLRFRSKIETLFDFGNLSFDWNAPPLKHTGELITLRNWLVHFKESDIGLINSDGDWIVDSLNKLPKRNPDTELTFANVEKLYQAVRKISLILAEGVNAKERFDYLQTEDYNAFLVG